MLRLRFRRRKKRTRKESRNRQSAQWLVTASGKITIVWIKSFVLFLFLFCVFQAPMFFIVRPSFWLRALDATSYDLLWNLYSSCFPTLFLYLHAPKWCSLFSPFYQSFCGRLMLPICLSCRNAIDCMIRRGWNCFTRIRVLISQSADTQFTVFNDGGDESAKCTRKATKKRRIENHNKFCWWLLCDRLEYTVCSADEDTFIFSCVMLFHVHSWE